MLALADLVVALLIIVAGLGLHVIDKSGTLGGLIYTRSVFCAWMFFLIMAGTAYGVSRFVHDYPAIQEKYFRQWFGAMIVVIFFVILSLGLFY